MILACSTTSQIPSDTANSIQAVMACEGLRRCGQEIRLFVPGEGTAVRYLYFSGLWS